MQINNILYGNTWGLVTEKEMELFGKEILV